ncbi:MAG: hypothetical protein H0Z19_09965 [Archaeoglobus sp.]|uniref:hypothetical protein n=1 Tax=Archaeoglobus sp. TaxID=1872626 RepID=UPI001DAF8090|nr:hypothetical protein [Archaeoglobus sp.]MBO8180781.1 hypothetical protein [Archaeoglobus sp.]
MATFDKKDLERMLSDIKTELTKKLGKKRIVFVDASSNTTVPAGSSETITIQPPQGKIWRILMMNISVSPPNSSTTGTHKIVLSHSKLLQWHMVGVYEYNNTILFYKQVFTGTVSVTNASTPEESRALLDSIKATYDYPMQFRYYNDTDADQTNTRVIGLLIEEEDEAE